MIPDGSFVMQKGTEQPINEEYIGQFKKYFLYLKAKI